MLGDTGDAASAEGKAPLSPPYGYSFAGEGGATVPNEAEVEVIARVRELSKKHATIRDIVAKLADEGLDCRGEPFEEKVVAGILRRKVDKRPGTGQAYRR